MQFAIQTDHGNPFAWVTLQPHKEHLVLQFTMQTPSWAQAGQVPGPSKKAKFFGNFGVLTNIPKLLCFSKKIYGFPIIPNNTVFLVEHVGFLEL